MFRSIECRLLASLYLLVSVASVAELPVIVSLDRSDPLFVQQQADVERYYRQAASGSELPPLLIYRYRIEPGDTLFAVASRLNVPYSAIATLNRLAGPSLDGVEELLLPGVPGVFLPLSPSTDLEYIMADVRSDLDALVVTVAGFDGQTVYRFFPGQDFAADERRAFLGQLFRHPLHSARVSSPFGPRTNPFTGAWTMHYGVDFAAPTGTPVVAARGGVVSDTGYDLVMGNYVLLTHTGGFETFYGHLEFVTVSLNQQVASGMMMGVVGATGVTTGSHLHFEIRHNGRHRNPLLMLPRGGR